MKNLTHLSLFSGIGGLDLAAEWAGFETVGQCEFADYPYKVLCKHWPDVPKWRDIHELSAGEFHKTTGIEPGQLTCISGGFPCQPHSVAGKRKASCDERDLWPEMRRVIGEIKPKWVVGENVRGLLSSEDGRFFRGILRDFAEMGYDVGWEIIRACDAGAIHKRERVAIVARKYDHSEGRQNEFYPYSNHIGFKRRLSEKKLEKTAVQFERFYVPLINKADKNYLLKSGILRKNDGFSAGMDRVKCLGNAVVPQQFYPVFKAIYDIETAL